MKRLIGIAAAGAVLLSISATAFAQTPAQTPGPDLRAEEDASVVE